MWAVQTIWDNPNFVVGSETEPHNYSNSKVFQTRGEGLAAYGDAVKSGIPQGSKNIMIDLWRTDPHPTRVGKLHTLVRHRHIWTDENGTHSNEFCGAVEV